MSNDKTHEQYVASMLEQFDALAATAMQAWPHPDRPLSSADFSAARYELLNMMNQRRDNPAMTSAAQNDPANNQGDPDAGQYLPVTPAPWP